MSRFEKYCTSFVQLVGNKDGAVSPSIVGSASFGYGDSQNAEGIFSGSVKKPVYARMGNPTSAKLENLLAAMDGGIGAIATSSGMSAITLAVMSIVQAFDEVISIGGLFGGTYSFFNETLSRFGVKTSFFDVDELQNIKNAINDKTKLIFLESVGNPNMRLPDIKAIAKIANDAGVALMIDNTITPLCVKPFELGVDIIVYSTTKIISGNASALGGAVVYRAIGKNDKFSSNRYKELHPFIKKADKMALVVNAKKRGMRDFGMSASAFNSYLTLLGSETLPLRIDRITSTVEQVVKVLDENGLHVNHPSLSSHPHHQRYLNDFKDGCGTLFTIDMRNKQKAFEFLNNTTLPVITANIGDSRTLALHMASTIYSDFDDETRAFLGITDGLIRVSVGLENALDIISDFLKAAKHVK